MGRSNRQVLEMSPLRAADVNEESLEGIVRAIQADEPLHFPDSDNPALQRILERLSDDPQLSGESVASTGMTEKELGHFVRAWFESIGANPGDVIVLEPTHESQKEFVRMAGIIGQTQGIEIKDWWPDEQDPEEWSGRADFVRKNAGRIIFSQLSAGPGSDMGAPGHIKAAMGDGNLPNYKNYERRWNLSYIPNMKWARQLAADPFSGFEGDETEVFRQLAHDLHDFMRTQEKDGPNEHLRRLQAKEDRLNEIFQEIRDDGDVGVIHIDGPEGVSLQMTLTDTTQWISGRTGILFGGQEGMANTITEEVWATPNQFSVRGKFCSSAPLQLDDIHGTSIERLEGEFDEKGRLMKLRAMRKKGDGWEEDKMGTKKLAHYFDKDINNEDEPWPSCGEIGLVDSAGPIAQTGRKYLAIGLDENGALHIAIGDCYKENGGEGEEGSKHPKHLDVPIGSPETSVAVVRQGSGERIPLIERGRFLF